MASKRGGNKSATSLARQVPRIACVKGGNRTVASLVGCVPRIASEREEVTG